MLIAFIQLLVRDDRARTFITVIGALVIACAAVFLAYEFVPLGSQKFAINSSVAELLGYVMLAIDVLLCLYIIGKGIAHKKYIAIILAIVQLCLAVYVDLFVADGIAVSHALYVDDLSVIMALIIASVPPQVTRISVSGLISRPYARPCLRASASRKFSAPKVTEY